MTRYGNRLKGVEPILALRLGFSMLIANLFGNRRLD